jgi:hypothetical protein
MLQVFNFLIKYASHFLKNENILTVVMNKKERIEIDEVYFYNTFGTHLAQM